jgi:hypothetical protein
MSRKVAEPGTVISGTMRMRTFDIVNMLLAALEYLDEEAYEALLRGAPALNEAEFERNHPYWNSAGARYLIEELFDALGKCAPPGHYFGSHPRDGADVGFWPVEGDET